MKIDIIIQPGTARMAYGESADAYNLGTVESLMPMDVIKEEINLHWAAFKESKPDWDGNFLHYLSQRGYMVHPCNHSIVLTTD